MKIVCAPNIALADEIFSPLGTTTAIVDRPVEPDDIKDADALIVRSTQKIDADLLDNSTVRFVGTTTIGYDHLDISYLDSRGIKWCAAPGCNANSVREYLTTAILHLASKHKFNLANKTMGIIGVGNIGTKMVKTAQSLGMNTLLCDPPRQEREDNKDQFTDLSNLLEKSDIITMHTPLTKNDPHHTYHMADASFFDRMQTGSIFINAARGPLVKTEDLITAIKSHKLAHTIIDTWEGEPEVNRELLDLADIATPHIAGHSYEGKVMGSIMIYNELCAFLNVEPIHQLDNLLPTSLIPTISDGITGNTHEEILHSITSQIYDIMADDKRMKRNPEDFVSMRQNYQIRREFRFTEVISNILPADLPDIGLG